MIRSELLVRDIVQAFNHSGFTNDTMEERDLFLSCVVICFVNYLEDGYYDQFVELLFNIVDEADLLELKSENANFIKASHASHFQEFLLK